MTILMVTNQAGDWPAKIGGVEVVDAREYLTNPQYSEQRGAKVFNLCRSYKYQSIGYYVSLLAEARGHKPIPNITTINEMKTQAIVRIASAVRSSCSTRACCSARSSSRLCRSLTKYPVSRSSWHTGAQTVTAAALGREAVCAHLVM